MSLSVYLEKQHRTQNYRIRPFKEAVVITIAIFMVVFSVSYFIYVRALDAQKGEIREGLIRTAMVIATMLDGDVHKQFKNRSQESGELYKNFIKPLEKVLATDDTVVFIYTTILKGDQVYFVVDPTVEGDSDGDGVDDKSHIMELYADADAALRLALTEQKAVPTDEPYTDKWGSFMSAYVPFYDNKGEFVGVLGIDIKAENYFTRLKPMLRATVRAMVAGFFVAFLVGSLVWFMRNFSLIINRHRVEISNDFEGMKSELSKKRN